MHDNKKPINELNEFAEKNKNTLDEKIKEEVAEVEKLLQCIRREAENIMKNIKVINE